jgi:hypothetical protein
MMRSIGDGVPPRCGWPSATARESHDVFCRICSDSQAPMPPRRACPKASTFCSTVISALPAGIAPSATTTTA